MNKHKKDGILKIAKKKGKKKRKETKEGMKVKNMQVFSSAMSFQDKSCTVGH